MTKCTESWFKMNGKYAMLKADNFDLKIENKMFMKENSRLNKIIKNQKQVLIYCLFGRIKTYKQNSRLEYFKINQNSRYLKNINTFFRRLWTQ